MRGVMRSAGISFSPSPVQMFMMHGWPSSSARYCEMRIHALPCSTQNLRVSGFGLESVSGSHFGCEKYVGLKSQPSPRSLQNFTHGAKCFGSSLSLSTQPPFSSVKIA